MTTQTNAANLSAKGIEVTAFHRDVFKAAEAGRKAGETMLQKMVALLRSKYAAVAPTFEQYRADQKALAEIAKERGLTDNQWVRKPFALAVKTLYGALPEAQTAAAMAKRKLREANAAAGVKAGAPKGETAPRRQSEPETLEQYITRVGVFKVLQQCALILECVDDTKAFGNIVREQVKQARAKAA
jgi:hypothetical protein